MTALTLTIFGAMCALAGAFYFFMSLDFSSGEKRIKGYHTHVQVKRDPHTGAKTYGKYLHITCGYEYEMQLHYAGKEGFTQLEQLKR